jgi:hypothetical protein
MNNNELIRLSELGVATIYEASGREGLIDIPLIQLLPGSRAAGPARTVKCGQDDNLMGMPSSNISSQRSTGIDHARTVPAGIDRRAAGKPGEGVRSSRDLSRCSDPRCLGIGETGLSIWTLSGEMRR